MTTDKALKMKVSIQPLAGRVALRQMEETEQQRGGVLIPAMVKEKPQRVEVVAVGPGRYEKGVRVPMELSIGHTVLYEKYNGSEVIVADKEYLIIEESSVLAIVSR